MSDDQLIALLDLPLQGRKFELSLYLPIADAAFVEFVEHIYSSVEKAGLTNEEKKIAWTHLKALAGQIASANTVIRHEFGEECAPIIAMVRNFQEVYFSTSRAAFTGVLATSPHSTKQFALTKFAFEVPVPTDTLGQFMHSTVAAFSFGRISSLTPVPIQ